MGELIDRAEVSLHISDFNPQKLAALQFTTTYGARLRKKFVKPGFIYERIVRIDHENSSIYKWLEDFFGTNKKPLPGYRQYSTFLRSDLLDIMIIDLKAVAFIQWHYVENLQGKIHIAENPANVDYWKNWWDSIPVEPVDHIENDFWGHFKVPGAR